MWADHIAKIDLAIICAITQCVGCITKMIRPQIVPGIAFTYTC